MASRERDGKFSPLLLEGRLEEDALAEVLIRVASGRWTGILTVQGEEEIIGLSFLQGDVVSADALNQTLEEGLGEILMTRALVDQDRYAALVSEHQAGGGRVTELLVERGYLPEETLLGALRLHLYRLCLQVLVWRRGDFKFYRGEEVAYEQGLQPMPVEELLVRAQRDLGDRGPLSAPVPADHQVLEIVGALPDPAAPERSLSELLGSWMVRAETGKEALALLRAVDGRRTAKELVEARHMDRFRGLYALYLLGHAGLVSPVAAEPDALVAPGEPEAEAERPARSRRWRPARRLGPELAPELSARVKRRLGAVLALGLLAGLAGVILSSPGRAVLPLPGSGILGEGLQRHRVVRLCQRIDAAAEIFFLLQGRYPLSLAELTELGLLRGGDLQGGAAGSLDYASDPTGYLLRKASEPERLLCSGSIKGNFLLDPDFLAGAESERPPLILLD